MSGLSHAEDVGFKAHYDSLKQAIEEKFPNEKVYLKEEYKHHVLKGQRLKLTVCSKNSETEKITELATHYVPIPKYVPEWITKKDLWHHTHEELQLLKKLSDNQGEKSPSKNTMAMWKQILADNVRKTNHNQKHIPIPSIR